MKNSIKIAAFGFAALVAGLCSCNDAEYSELGVHAFVSENTAGKSTKVTITDQGANATVTAGLSDVLSHDVKLKFVVDQQVLEDYNRRQAASFMALPAELLEMEQEVIIKAGEFTAAPTKIHIKPITGQYVGESYAVPLRLVSVDGGVPVTNVTGTYVISTEAVITSSLPMFNGGAGLTAEGFPQTIAEFTVEVRFQVSNMAKRNRALFSNGGSVLLRFEDPQNDTPEFKRHSLVQFQGDGWYLNPSIAFEPNKWQHLALTYNGAAATLYVNGAFAGSKSGVAAADFPMVGWFGGGGDGGSHGTGDTWWSGCKILCSEARIWSVARTQTQIQNSMTTTSSKAPGLVAYWRMNEGKGNVFTDCTGNGHTMNTSTTPTWVENIKSTDESTPW